ncbi:hypothetical protein [uncultured Serratia sp.]|uniref:TRAFAC clade GTPase domain-containing protein n=1 Tax=uncultured Serratia sp. TaxID=239175 RepID=UPI00258DC07B|nr:hypothetical protein [uncultured Serratia sp.]
MQVKKISFLGLPSSGKSTFLAALWHLILTDEVECPLSLNGFTSDYPYLNSIHSHWIDGNPLHRTSMESEQIAELNLIQDSSKEQFTLLIPDLSGEEFELQLSRKKVKTKTFEMINEATGIVLFLSADKKDGDVYFHQVGKSKKIRKGNVENISWDYHLIPTQVKIVELLQTLMSFPFVKESYRISFIISAWDVVMEREITPDTWIKEEYPLLQQFLETNSKFFLAKIYGVSAQGGDLNDPKKKLDLTSMYTASERIICHDGNNLTHDITKPLIWIINGND